MATLWNISSDLLDIEALLTESEGEIADDEAGEALAAWFDQLIEDRDNKIDNYCRLITSITARANARAAEASRLDALTTTDQLAVERLKTALKTFMERHDLKKLETPLHKLTVAANGGRLPLIIPETWQQDPELAPEAYHKTRITLDTTAIRADLDAGDVVEGCGFGERGTHLRIK